jgi:hypothetical protein
VDRPDIKELLVKAGDKALTIQQPIVRAHVRRIRRSRPDASPAEVVRSLERHYLSTVAGLGMANGAVAAAPGPGTAAATALAALEIPSYIEATTLFVLAVSEVHDVDVEDLEYRRLLVMAVLMGNAGVETVRRMSERTGQHWASRIVGSVSGAQLRRINDVLGRHFVTKHGTKQGILVLGRDVPFGIGAVIGAGGNYALGRASVKAARKAFGPAPREWGIREGLAVVVEGEVVESEPDDRD